jgi:predicted nucleic acid-binding protein
MNYLLDVNALVALHHANSAHHAAFHRWVAGSGAAQLSTCALAELGFLRVSIQAFKYDSSQAARALQATKAGLGFVGHAPSPALLAWANTAAKTTDAYFVQVATEAGLTLATFDTGIPGAELIK